MAVRENEVGLGLTGLRGLGFRVIGLQGLGHIGRRVGDPTLRAHGLKQYKVLASKCLYRATLTPKYIQHLGT